jgi:hypothetical protein
MFLQLLAFWHAVTVWWQGVQEAIKARIRSVVGPAPACYFLLEDGRVLPATIELPIIVRNTAHIYDPTTHRLSQGATEGVRFRRLQIIALSLTHPSVGTLDLSDWVGDLRAHPVPEIGAKQLLTLWSMAQNTYVPLSDGAQVTITKNDGETDLITFE